MEGGSMGGGGNPCPCWYHLAVEFTLKFLLSLQICFVKQ